MGAAFHAWITFCTREIAHTTRITYCAANRLMDLSVLIMHGREKIKVPASSSNGRKEFPELSFPIFSVGWGERAEIQSLSHSKFVASQLRP